jgi:hypothetical protein
MPTLDDENFPTSVTSRSRRRRKQKNTIDSQKENIRDDDRLPEANRENARKCTSKDSSKSGKDSSRKTKTTTARSKSTGNRKNKRLPTLSSTSVLPPDLYGWKYSDYQSPEETLYCFRAAVEKLPCEEAALWKNDRSLANNVVEASLSLLQTTRYNDAAPLVLHEFSATLLSTCRKIVKKAAESKSKDFEPVVSFLFVAVHGLRALLTAPLEMVQREAIIRLLYHIITTASSALVAICEEHKKSKNLIDRAGAISLAGYQALSHLLRIFSVQVNDDSDGKDAVSFEYLTQGENLQETLHSFFPVPIMASDEVAKTKRNSSMALSQIFTIGTQSTLAVAHALVCLSCESRGLISSLLNSYENTIDNSDSLPMLPLHTTILFLLRQVGMRWLAFMSLHDTENDSSFLKEGVSFCKQAHRIIWDLASRTSKQQLESKPDYSLCVCLELRKHAILALLGQIYPFSQSVSSFHHNLGSTFDDALREKHFESACTMAWKAATNYMHNQKKAAHSSSSLHGLTNECVSPLQEFHSEIGAALDSMAAALIAPESHPYVEYCAYRAIQIGSSLPVQKTVIETRSCQHKQSTTHPCVFSQLPFHYTHKRSFGSKKKNAGYSNDAPFSIALALFHLMLQVKNDVQHSSSSSQEIANFTAGSEYAHATCVIESFRAAFVEVHSNDNNAVPISVESCCFKLLSMIPLHSTLFNVLNLPIESMLRNINIIALETAAKILTSCIGPLAYSIVTERPPQEAKKAACTWDLVVESFSRSALLWDARQDMEENGCHEKSSYFLEQSGTAMSTLFGMLKAGDIDGRKPAFALSSLEKAAKVGLTFVASKKRRVALFFLSLLIFICALVQIFASIGKRRLNRNELQSVVAPLLYSLSLFTNVANTCEGSACPTSCSDTQQASRWSSLASVFQSLGRSDEASLATAAALHYSSRYSTQKSDQEEQDPIIDVVHFVGSQSEGVIATGCETQQLSDLMRGLLRRLVNNMLVREKLLVREIRNVPYTFSIQDAIQILLAAEDSWRGNQESELAGFFEQRSSYHFNLTSILRFIFQGDEEIALPGYCYKIKLLGSVLKMIGQGMQRSLCDSEASVNEYFSIYEEVLGFMVEAVDHVALQVHEETDAVRSAMRAMLYVMASVCLLSKSPFFEQFALGISDGKITDLDHSTKILLPIAKQLSEEAWENVAEELVDGGDWVLMYSAIRAATNLFRQNLASLPQALNPVVPLELTSESVIQAFNESQLKLLDSIAPSSGLFSVIHCCIASALSRARDILSFRGHKLLAARVAMWQKMVGTNDGLEHQWIRALTVNLLLTGGLFEVAFDMEQLEEEEDFPEEGDLYAQRNLAGARMWHQLAEAERLAGQLRLQLCTSRPAHLEQIRQQLRGMLNDIDSCQRSIDDEDEISVISQAAKSTVLFALSEVAEHENDIENALVLVRLCFKCCQAATQNSEQLVISGSSVGFYGGGALSRTALPTVIMGSLEKQVDCLRRTAILYAKIGDHRKSEAYSISAMKCSKVRPKGMELKPKIHLNELLSIVRKQAASNGQEQVSRRLLLWMKATSTAHDVVVHELKELPLSPVRLFGGSMDISGKNHSKNALVDEIEDLLVGKCASSRFLHCRLVVHFRWADFHLFFVALYSWRSSLWSHRATNGKGL